MKWSICKIIKALFVFLVIIAPFALYVYQFRFVPISSDPNDWAAFGSYIGGVYSVIVAVLAVYLARALSKKDEVRAKQKKAIDAIYLQILKVHSDHVDTRSVDKIFKLLDANRLYLPDSIYNEVRGLADYFLEVKGGANIDYNKENRVKDLLKLQYNA